MTTPSANLRSWVLRTIGSKGTSVSDIHHHFTVEHPDRNSAELEEVLENRRDIAMEESGDLRLTEDAQRELEEIGKHEYTRRYEQT